MSNEQSIRDEPSLEEVRADFITLHTRSFDAYMVGRSLTSEQEFYGAQFDSVIRRIQAEALREAAEALNEKFQDIPAWMEAYRAGVRTDEWTQGGVRMVMSAIDVLNRRADAIERGETA